MESIKEKKIKKALEVMFAGMDDDVLKTVILYTSTGKSEEEIDKVCEEIRKKKEEDMEYIKAFEITVDKENPMPDMQQNITFVLEEKEADEKSQSILELKDGED